MSNYIFAIGSFYVTNRDSGKIQYENYLMDSDGQILSKCLPLHTFPVTGTGWIHVDLDVHQLYQLVKAHDADDEIRLSDTLSFISYTAAAHPDCHVRIAISVRVTIPQSRMVGLAGAA